MTASDDALLAVKRIARRAGLELRRFNPANVLDAQRAALIKRHNIDLVIDGGAHTGQWASLVRWGGYRDNIVSFEPLSAAYNELAARTARDAAWEVRRAALDAVDGEAEINVAGNLESSSLLDMADKHLDAAPESAYVGSERVPVRRLDGCELPVAHDLMLKLDVQGAELRALEGAEGLFDRIRLIELELSVCELYVGAPLLPEVAAWLEERGYRLVGVEPGLVDLEIAELLQVNGIFLRSAP
jgi:FkbM family methyltransferase